MKTFASVAFTAGVFLSAVAASAQIVALQEKTTIQPSLGMTYGIDLDGFVHIFAGSFSPNGFGAANGQEVNIVANLDLFNRIGTTYGGDGSTTFALPNLSGRGAVGSGTGPGLTTKNLGDVQGQESVFLNNNQYPPGVGGLAQPFTNEQPTLTLNYIISQGGVFPSRPDPGFSGGTQLNFLGQIALFAGNIAPIGWHFADGSLLSISGNTALFSLLGTTYGGDGRTTFALPDLRDRLPVGVGTGPGLTTRSLGEVFGTETTTLNNTNIPAVLGGAGQPYDNMQPSLGINFMISPAGIFPSRDAVEIVHNPGGTEPFLGEIFMFGGNFIPQGFLPTDGSTLNISSHTALFSLLGTSFGGDGKSTFDLPDLRGRTIIGTGNGPGLTPRVQGEEVGVEKLFLDAVAAPPPPGAVPEPATFVYVALAGIALIAHRVRATKKKIS